MADSPEFLAQSTEGLAAARAKTRAKFQGFLTDTEERKFYKVILLDLQKQMEVSQNVVRTLHSDPTFNSDKDSVVEQLMGQIRNMEDTISSILVALEYGPDMGTSYRLNQVSQATLAGDDAEGSQANLEGGEDPEETQEFFDLLVKVSLLTTKGYDAAGVVLRLGKLEELNLDSNKHLSDTRVQELLTSSGSILKELDLHRTKISDAALAGVQLPKLEVLNLSYCSNLTDTGVQELLTTSGSILKKLDLRETSISDAALAGVRLPKLEVLSLNDCSNLTDTGVQELLTSSGSMLKDLDLGNTDISDAALAGVQLPKLEELSLYGCRNLTMTRIQELLTSSGSIRKRLVLVTGNHDC